MKARTICLCRLLEEKSIIEAVEEQLTEKIMFCCRRIWKTIVLLAETETSAVNIFSEIKIQKKMWKFIQSSKFHVFFAFCFFFSLVHTTHTKPPFFVN